MNYKRERIFNKRPICFFAFFLMLGIVLGEAFELLNPLYRFIPLAIFICLIVLSFSIKKIKKIAYFFIALLLGFSAICCSSDLVESRKIGEYTGVFQATVCSEIVVDDGKTTFYIEDITVRGKLLKGKSFVYLGSEIVPDFGGGDRIEIVGKILSNEHVPFDSMYANRVGKKIYFFSVPSEVAKIAELSPKFPLSFQLKVKKLLFENTDEHTASIAQALLLGDKRGIDTSMYDDVKTSGLAHVLAVSGLHITAIAGALYWLLKKIKLNSKINFFIVTILTFLYVLLCGFSPSAMRAFIMTFVFAFASSFGLKHDNLSTLALSAVIIMLVRPTAVMDVGFLLSMFAVLGIFLFYKPFKSVGMNLVNRISPKRKFGTKAMELASVSLSTNLMTYPFVALFFGAVPALFLVSNLLMLPYLMFSYLFSIIITLFALLSGMSGVVGILAILFKPFKIFVASVGSLSFASIPVSITVIGVIAYLLCMPILSRFVFLTKRKKTIAILSVCSICCALSSVLYLVQSLLIA